ncbi:MAG: ATP-binding cassette domain-containing protein [Acidobacteriota bacterium]|nr:ATP-binding cassette domain-containing protein [Acidobacteriota bacterium]
MLDEMDAPALQAIDVHKHYPGDVRALSGVDLGVAAGETLALVGESGSGKTTLLRMFNRLVEPTSGNVRVRGRDVGETDPIALRRATGYVQQEGGLLPHWTVARNIALVPRLTGWPEDRIRRRVDDLLDLVGLDPAEFGERYPVELSGGERQRVAFARAVAADPEVILLDEPFGALDALTRLDVQRHFLHLKEGLGKTMLLVTHDLREAFRLADRIAVMRHGRIEQCDTPQALRHAPAPGYVAALLGRVGDDS